MAVTKIIEDPLARSASFGRDGATFGRSFKVYTDARTDGPYIVAKALGFKIGDRYDTGSESYNTSFCSNVTPKCTALEGDSGAWWEVGVEFTPADQEQQNPEDPTTEPPQVRFGFVTEEKIFTQDADGNAILNAAGDPFNPPVKLPVSYPTLTITRNEPTFDAAIACLYKDATNADPIFGVDHGWAKLNNIQGERVWGSEYTNIDGSKGRYYYKVSYELAFNPDGWKTKVLNAGLRELVDDGAGGFKLQAIRVNGQPVTEPYPLDANGKRLPQGADPVWIEIPNFKEIPFQPLALEYA